MTEDSDSLSEEERSLFRPFTRESLLVIQARIAEENAKQKELERKRAEGEVSSIFFLWRHKYNCIKIHGNLIDLFFFYFWKKLNVKDKIIWIFYWYEVSIVLNEFLFWIRGGGKNSDCKIKVMRIHSSLRRKCIFNELVVKYNLWQEETFNMFTK